MEGNTDMGCRLLVPMVPLQEPTVPQREPTVPREATPQRSRIRHPLAWQARSTLPPWPTLPLLLRMGLRGSSLTMGRTPDRVRNERCSDNAISVHLYRLSL